MGKKLAQGGFGTVYRGQLKEDDGALTEVVIKRVRIYHAHLFKRMKIA